jgi:ribosomal protein S18 acetylase RimI-like enzyme
VLVCRGSMVISFRRFRNTDPPGLLEVWNEAATGRGAFPLRTPALLERWIFSKPYFEHDALIVAEDSGTGQLVGWSLAGFGPNAEQTAVDPRRGIVCCVLVRPSYRRRGIGRELLQRAEAFLRGRGAEDLRFGSMAPNHPYLFGLYGGANSPGVLASDPHAEPFITAMGYRRVEARRVFQRKLDQPLSLADPRFAMIRRGYEGQLILRGAAVASWWTECVWGTLEPSELRLCDKQTGQIAGRAIVWELEGFSWRWGYPSAGIVDVFVREDLRRQGLAKLMLLDMLRFLQEQFFGIAELHIPENDPAAEGLVRSLQFEQVDTGFVYGRV